MGKSLQDQLLSMGVASDKQAKKIKTDKRKQKKQQQGKQQKQDNQNQTLTRQLAAAKAEKDRQLNKQRQQQAEQKAIAAQVKQLVDANKKLQGNEEIPYHFVFENKVKTVYVNEEIKTQLTKGQLVIVAYRKGYQVISTEIAEKIKQRTDANIVIHTVMEDQALVDDEYQEYQIPDDLMW